MSTVSNKTKRLLALRVPVRCRGEAEAMGLQLWTDAAAHLDTLLERTRENRETNLRFFEQSLDLIATCQSVTVLDAVRDLIDAAQEAFPSYEAGFVAERVWCAMAAVQLALARGLVAPMQLGKNSGPEVRDLLRYGVELSESKGPAGVEAAEVARWVLKRPDGDLGVLAFQVDWDFFEDFFNEGPDRFGKWQFSDETKARAEALLAQALADLNVSSTEIGIREEQSSEHLRAVSDSLEAARSMLPDTGEVADFRQVVALLPGYLEASAEDVALRLAELRRSTTNRFLLRWGVWLELGDVVWTPVARATLAALIAHPKAFARHAPTGKEAERVAERLRVLRPYCVGFHPEPEQGSLLHALADATRTDEEVRWLLSDYVIASATRGSGPATGGAGPADLLVERVCDAWQGVPKHSRPELLRRFMEVRPSAVPTALRTATDEAVEALAAAEEAVAAKLEVVAAPVVPASTVPPMAAQVEAPAPRGERWRWSYVANPTSPHPRIETVESGRSSAVEVVASLILKHTTPVEPAASLARALYHYVTDMTDAQRQLLNKETAGHQVFHKLKRGAARIYVRKLDNTVLFHVYARRDWSLPKAFV